MIHWATAFLVIAAIISINARGPIGTQSRFFWANVHFWAGFLVIWLTAPRLIFRLWVGIGDSERSASSFLNRAVRLSLFAFLVIQPVLGVLTVNAAGSPLILYGLDIPIVVIAPNEALATVLHSLHENIGVAFYWIIGLHFGAGLIAIVRNRRKPILSSFREPA
jgi:cytochrome b561